MYKYFVSSHQIFIVFFLIPEEYFHRSPHYI